MSRRDPENLAVSIDDSKTAGGSPDGTATKFDRDSPHAWRMVAAGFLAAFTLFGGGYSFGAFFKPIAAQFRPDRLSTSAIFSISSRLSFFLVALTLALPDRFCPQ